MKLPAYFPAYRRLSVFGARLAAHARQDWASRVLLFALFWMAAAAGISGGLQKHGLPDGARGGGIEAMLDASAKKPYVYRQLAPLVANALDQLVPSSLKEAIGNAAAPDAIYVRVRSAAKPEFRFRYVCVYYLGFLTLLGSLFLLRRILLDYGVAELPALAAPAIFAFAFPYVQTVGGYYYDAIELFFTAAAFLAAMRSRVAVLLAVALFATLNKEAFFFFVPALYPLLRNRLGNRRALLACAAALLVAGLVNAAMKIAFFHAPGVAAEFKLFRNILEYLNPLTYLQLENTYGIVGPHGAFAGTLLVIALVVVRGWRDAAPEVRQHVLIGAGVNLPLFVLFCAPGELRNLSLMFVGFVVLSGHALQAWQGVTRRPTRAGAAHEQAAPVLDER
jgi:hypothetical protein